MSDRADYVDLYGMHHALESQLIERNPHMRRPVTDCRELMTMAIGYAMGFQDASGEAIFEAYGRLVVPSWEFGYMYGIVCLMGKLGMIGMRPCIPAAWNAFRAGRDLTDYGTP